MPGNNELCKKYDDFIDNYIKPKLEDLAGNSSKIAITYKESNEKNQSLVWFHNVDTKAIFGLSNFDEYCDIDDQKIDNSSCVLGNNRENANCMTRFHFGSIEDKFLRFIIQQFFNKNATIPCGDTNYKERESFTVEQLVQKLREYKDRPDFCKIDITNVIENDPVEHCRTSAQNIKSTTTEEATLAKSNSSEELTKWLSSIKSKTQNITKAMAENGTVNQGSDLMLWQMSKSSTKGYLNSTTTTSPLEHNLNLTQATATLTAIISSIATMLPTNSTTTPTIGYSTNTSVTNVNHSTTTSKPEQGDDIDKSHIAVIVGTSIVGIMFFCFIGYYCWRKARHSGKYYTNEKGQEEGTPPVAKDTQPLLNQPSASASGGVELSEVQTLSPNRTQAQVHTQPPSGDGASPSLREIQVENPAYQASIG